MLEFNWEGKELAYKLAQTPSTATLIPCKEESKNWDTTENLYIEGDNLEVLKLLQKTYYEKVKMIYIDPPYNTGKDFIYKDNFKDNMVSYNDTINQSTKTNSETNGRYHTDWLNMMYPRLKLARNLLREDGVIFISIDDNEVENLKKICNEIFGEENFAGCAGRITKKSNNKGDFWSPNFDYILTYVKNINKAPTFFGGINYNAYNLIENEGPRKGEKYQLVRLYMSSLQNRNPEQRFWIECPDGSKIIPPGSTFPPQRPVLGDGIWRWTRKKIEEEKDKIVIKKVSSSNLINENGQPAKWNIYTKTYLNDVIDNSTAKPNSFIENHINQIGSHEIKGLGIPFDYSKPSTLIKYLIEISKSDKDAIILDFFSGSATTAHAIMNSNIGDKGKRKFIMVQLPEPTNEKSEAYKAGYKNICEIGKERIRRAGDKIVSENKDKEGIENLDIGFKVFKLDYNKGDNKMYNEKLINSITIEILNNKKPKELKGKKKIATVNKDADYKVQVFVDDDYNLYYQDNHAFASCESKIVGNKVETTWNSCKCWFKITGLYECRNNHIVDILRGLNQYSEYLYSKNNVADNIALSRLYEQMINTYLEYIHENN